MGFTSFHPDRNCSTVPRGRPRRHARRSRVPRGRPRRRFSDGPAQSVSPVLSIDNLTLALPRLGDRRYAVQDLSLAVAAGETLCVVGESGSGKSMTAHAVMGLLPAGVTATVGAIRLAGRDLLELDEAALCDL